MRTLFQWPRFFSFLMLVPLTSAGAGQLDSLTDRSLAHAVRQLKRSVEVLHDSTRIPRSTLPDGSWKSVLPTDWTSGFFPGSLWYLYDYTRDPALRVAAERWTAAVEDQQWNRGTHDLGFMIYCSFGQGYRLTANAHYRDVVLQAARTLSQRFHPVVGCTKSWDWSKKWQFPVIIDNMMNLELLFWAAKNGGDPRLREIAISHADRTIEHHLRTDGSTYHVVDYDTTTGMVRSKQTHQGYADESVWARGQAWAVYGFTMAYRETELARYLGAAKRVADYFLGHLPDDRVPYWDFKAPGIPREPRDASAAAIAASALLELSTVAGNAGDAERYEAAAEAILASLCSKAYLTEEGTTLAVLNHAVGNKPGDQEVDVSLVYGDYYFIEALLRYKRRSHP